MIRALTYTKLINVLLANEMETSGFIMPSQQNRLHFICLLQVSLLLY